MTHDILIHHIYAIEAYKNHSPGQDEELTVRMWSGDSEILSRKQNKAQGLQFQL